MENVDGAGITAAAAAVGAVFLASVAAATAATAAALEWRADDEIGDAVVVEIACSSNAAAETRSIALAQNYRPRTTLEDGGV